MQQLPRGRMRRFRRAPKPCKAWRLRQGNHPLTPCKKEESELERREEKRTEMQKAVKISCAVLVILTIAILLIISAKVQKDQAGEKTSGPVASEQQNMEVAVKESSTTPGDNVEDSPAPGAPADDSTTSGEAADDSTTPEDAADDSSDTSPVTFDLQHAITVGESIHLSSNGDLEWQGKIVHHKGGTLGAYEEVVNIFNGTDSHIYEIYDVLVNAHPELKTTHLEPYECEDINDYYGFTVSRAPSDINEIDNALREGRLVQLQVHSNKWRNFEGELVDWPGYHSGLIFYFDGSLYHMKAAGTINQKNAVYTREQLIDWIGGTSKQLVIYTKHPTRMNEN